MNAPTAITDLDDPAAWSQAVLRRQVERLEALSELGLELAQAIVDEKADGTVTAFARVAKVVRLCGLLQAKLIKDMEDARRRTPANDHKPRAERIVERQVPARYDNEEQVERLVREACERLDHDDIYRDVRNRPIGELVARICKDLGLDPDWERLSQEGWAKEEMKSGLFHLPREAAGGGPSAQEPMVEGAGGYSPPFHGSS